MNNIKLVDIVKSDLYRCDKKTDIVKFIKIYLFNAGVKYLFWLRISKKIQTSCLVVRVMLPFAKFILRHYMYKFGISIPVNVDLGVALKINHFSGVIVNSKCKIGNNVTLSHGVTLGQSDRGKNIGCPTVGNEVFIGPGAKIFGNITIGNNASIGANAVVNFNVPDNAVVVGNPAKVVSMNGSEGYVKNIFIFTSKSELNK